MPSLHAAVRVSTAGSLLGASLLLGVAAAGEAHSDTPGGEVYPVPSSGVFSIEGHGWGHGHGLSQWGAQGAASEGVSADTITSTYYPHTAKGQIGDAPIRVLLQAAAAAQTQVLPASGLTVTDTATGAHAVLPSGPSRWRAVVDSAGLHLQQLNGSTWSAWALGGRTTLTGPVQFGGPTFVKVALANGSVRDYRGSIRAVKRSASTLSTIDVLGMEDYLLGVVPRESSSSWLPAALQAQAIAARSYSAYKRAHVGSGAVYDICDSTQCQVFGGAALYSSSGARTSLEPASTTAAVHATAGVVRTYQGQPVFAEFSSSNGGWSTDGGQPYLQPAQDPWDGATANNVHSWTATVSATQLQSSFPSIGTLLRLKVTQRDGHGDWGGRVKQVVLEGTKGSVTTTGSAVFHVNEWPASSTGLRSSWWHVKGSTDSTVVSQSAAPVLVQSPGVSTGTLAVSLRNSGSTSWPTADLHLAVSSPPGQADPLASGSTTPGTYTGSATSIAPGQVAAFTFALTGDGVRPGLQGRTYRLQNGTGPLYGTQVSWTVPVQAPTYVATAAARPTPADRTAPGGGAPSAVFSDGRTVVVPVGGSTAVQVAARNSSNVAWPAGTVRLATSAPRGATSTSTGTDWLNGSRAAALTSATPVGRAGTFSLDLHGNGRPVGVTTEAFEPLWEGRSWLAGDVTSLQVVRVDPTRAAAVLDSAPATVALASAPAGVPGTTAVLRVRLRNVGGTPWTLGSTTLAAKKSPLSTSAWPSATTTPALAGNVTRPGLTKVWPGEVGQWLVPVSAVGKAAGTYPVTVQVAGGPAVTTTATVTGAKLSGSVVAVHPRVTVPSDGTATTSFDVRNTGTVAWPVGGAVRSTPLTRGGSPSRASSWLSAGRPGAVASNVTRPGATSVLPGQVARFVIVLAGNGRAPAPVTEPFGVLWDGWARLSLTASVPYAVS